MVFQLGDKVRFLNDIGGGTVIGFLENSIVRVETEDGFEMPVSANELIHDKKVDVDERGKLREKSASSTAENKGNPRKLNLEAFKHIEFKGNASLAIVPENAELLHVSNFMLYLVNSSSYEFNYGVAAYEGKVATLISKGTIGPGKKLNLKTFSQTEITKTQKIQLQGFYSKEGLFDPQECINLQFSLEDYSFYKTSSFGKSKYFKVPAITLGENANAMKEAIEKLSKSDIAKVIKNKEKEDEKPPVAKPKQKPAIEEVDLHIEAIVDDHAGMSNGEIIRIQLDRFETSLETAINAKVSKIVFIHGVGNGKLKHELRKSLERKYSDLKYQDASFQEYGYGATMVYLR